MSQSDYRLDPFEIDLIRGYVGGCGALASRRSSVRLGLESLADAHVATVAVIDCLEIGGGELPDRPMTRPQVSLLLRVKLGSRVLPLNSRPRSVLECAHRVLKIGCWASNSKVIPAQVLLFLLVEHGLDLHRVAFVVEV